MPYFQRPSPFATTLPITDEPGREIASGAAAPIVELATAILDRERVSETAADAVGGARHPGDGLLPMLDNPALADLKKRASEVFAAFLEGFARPESLATLGSGAPTGAAMSESSPTVPLVATNQAVNAGQTANITVKLVNDRDAPANLILYSTDFVSDTGSQIPALQVTFSPRTLVLAGHEHGHAQMKVSIPAQSAPGRYSALVQAMGLGRPSAVVVLLVE